MTSRAISKQPSPTPLFDSLSHITETSCSQAIPSFGSKDYKITLEFLKVYDGSSGTFNSYRREVERLLHWSWLIARKSVKSLRRDDMDAYFKFCHNPPKSWIGLAKAPRFIAKEGLRIPNSKWRPFVATVSKVEYRKGMRPDKKSFTFSQTTFKDMFAILSTYYNYLIQEDYTEVNPILQIRQKSKYLRKQQGKPKIRRLSDTQWHYVIETAEQLAERKPKIHARTLFIMSALYSMYLRISELVANERWTPKMCDFCKDQKGRWWFTTVGKGNKERVISVSDAMLDALQKWRKHLDLSPLPSSADKSPLLPKTKGKGPITSATYIREIVQQCFDLAADRLKKDYENDEADALAEATVHWLRHTGISDDVKHRPREHVRDDAGHSSSATTDRYIDVELQERYDSAKQKPIKKTF